jgi:hypothetical protein
MTTRYNTPKQQPIFKCMSKEARKERNAKFYQSHKEHRKEEHNETKQTLINYYKIKLGSEKVEMVLNEYGVCEAIEIFKMEIKNNRPTTIRNNFRALPMVM